MISGLTRLKLVFARSTTTRLLRLSRRRSPRVTLAWGLIAFIALTAAHVWMIDDFRPEWRDPEYGYRHHQIRHWQAKLPQRPLLLIAGSSRIQMGLSPEAMGFPDEPGSPLPYNLGYRGAPPAASALHVLRVIDSGYIPKAVLFEFCPASLMAGGSPKLLREMWPGRMSYGDLQRLSELGTDENGVPGPSGSRAEWMQALFPWSSTRFTLLSYWLPEWVTPGRQTNQLSAEMDKFGFHGCPWNAPTAEQRRNSLTITRDHYKGLLTVTQIEPATDAALTALVTRCRSLGIPIAFVRTPESPEFRSWFTSEATAAGNAYAEQFSRKLGVTIFPAPDNLEETDFIDGYHLLKSGAERYTRWLTETHIKPWLAAERQR
jgi:hypothetical protein